MTIKLRNDNLFMYELFSVLMSVYYKENPLFLDESISSILSQTVLPDQVVIVKDGKLTKELDEVINFYAQKYKEIFDIVCLEKNMGAGLALSYGIKFCKNDIIAKMDSDDISVYNRFEEQLKIFSNNPGIGIVGSGVMEFTGSTNNITSRRILPENHDDILAFSKKRCPFNHPSVMYKKFLVESVGGYQHFSFFEDYFLWIRMLRSGVKGYNIQNCLVFMRAGDDMYDRRGGINYFKNVLSFRWHMFKNKYCSFLTFFISIFSQFIVCIVPNKLRIKLYEKFLRK